MPTGDEDDCGVYVGACLQCHGRYFCRALANLYDRIDIAVVDRLKRSAPLRVVVVGSTARQLQRVIATLGRAF